MKTTRRLTPLLLIALILSVLTSCEMMKKRRMDRFIAGMVEGGNETRAKVLSGGKIKDYKVFRDGDKTGVVFEYTFAKDVELTPTPDLKQTRAKLISQLRTMQQYESMMKYVRQGLYITYHYRKHDGTTHMKITLREVDLK